MADKMTQFEIVKTVNRRAGLIVQTCPTRDRATQACRILRRSAPIGSGIDYEIRES